MYIHGYQRLRTTRKDAPSVRVHAAINRCSRDRPLWPDEVQRLVRVFARLCTSSPQGEAHVVKAVMGYGWRVPWFRGAPVALPGDPDHRMTRVAVENADRRKPFALEVTLLRIVAGRSAMGRITELENHL